MFTGIKTDIIMSLVRHMLTLLGGLLVSKGYFSADILEQIIGALMTLVGTGWGAAQKVEANTANVVAVKQAAVTGAIPVGVSIPGVDKPSTMPSAGTVVPKGFPPPNA